MEIESPCLKCARKDKNKIRCAKKCPAIKEYNEVRDTISTLEETHVARIVERISKLAEEYVEKLKFDKKPEKRKYVKRKKKNKEHAQEKEQIKKPEQTVKQDSANPDVIKLYMSKYPEIATYVFEDAETFLLPARHVIMTLLAEAIIARKNASPIAC